MVERGMEYEGGTENGGRGLKAWQDDTGERALDVFVPGCVVHVRENVGMWEYVMMCISLCMFDYIWVLV